ncbi:MAG: hypothetical protein A4E74_01909 [Syntrophus sp. PtaB.Bin075]|nr:MAG: hypothetical protein A4E74_01909 [Syntrophus sp. PtaB.Bin075]
MKFIELLSEYRDNIVLIGGWVPELLIPYEPWSHVGSMDINLALNHEKIQKERYKLIMELLAFGAALTIEEYLKHPLLASHGRYAFQELS